jgi:hypothetical protein
MEWRPPAGVEWELSKKERKLLRRERRHEQREQRRARERAQALKERRQWRERLETDVAFRELIEERNRTDVLALLTRQGRIEQPLPPKRPIADRPGQWTLRQYGQTVVPVAPVAKKKAGRKPIGAKAMTNAERQRRLRRRRKK